MSILCRQYVVWRMEARNGQRTKVPIDPWTGSLAKTTDPSTWTTRAEAIAFANSHVDVAGVGYVTTLDDGLVLIDIDGCCNPVTRDVIEPWAQEILDARPGAFITASPSGTGLHLIVRGKPPTESTGRNIKIPGKYLKDGADHSQGIEMYHDRRYFTGCEDCRAPAPKFDGETFDAKRDQVRLSGQLARVHELMGGGCWPTLREIAEAVGGSGAGVSARLRDLRKDKFGGHTVDGKRRTGGLWEYRMEVGG